jgi:hypothetical protein
MRLVSGRACVPARLCITAAMVIRTTRLFESLLPFFGVGRPSQRNVNKE